MTDHSAKDRLVLAPIVWDANAAKLYCMTCGTRHDWRDPCQSTDGLAGLCARYATDHCPSLDYVGFARWLAPRLPGMPQREPLEAVLRMLDAKALDEHLIPSAVLWVKQKIRDALRERAGRTSGTESPT